MVEPRHGSIQLPLEWHVSPDVVSRYATNMVIQVGANEFILSFFEAIPPVMIFTPEEQGGQISQVRSVRAECVARLIVAAEKMPEFVRVLSAAVAKSLQTKEAE